jgi:hypothetical protein
MPASLLTKSLLVSAIECPTKLYYATRPEEYANQRALDPFLEALAEGGYQVGELAKQYSPGGCEIESFAIEEQIAETQKLLQLDQVTIFEAAICHNNLFVRVDILSKNSDHFELIEVKAKSYDPDITEIIGKRGQISSKWRPYVIDVAYQTHVLQLAYPQAKIRSYLMLVDKSVAATVDGINQKFTIVHASDQRKYVKVSADLSPADLVPQLLIKVPIDDAVKIIFEEKIFESRTFLNEVAFLSVQHTLGQKIKPCIGGKCKKCEFKFTSEQEEAELKSGFKECWQQVLGWNDSDFQEANVLEIANVRTNRLDDWLARGVVKITDVSEFDIDLKEAAGNGLSTSQRQWLQIEKSQNKDDTPYLDVPGLEEQMQQWIFPLHFIDFETARPALPFVKGRHPYETVAFQFSHHTIAADGTVTHAGEYLSVQRGEFPNYEFVRQLRDNLAQDEGTIFQYSPHENTTLNDIRHQLMTDENAPHDKEALCAFITTITRSPNNSKEKWHGDRCMVDLLKIAKGYYYDPGSHGSNSIKYILPALLNSSAFLKAKYSKPIYGAAGGIISRNYQNWSWVEESAGRVINPYDRLPKLFEGLDQDKLELLSQDDTLQQGGAALTAYGRMQFTAMSDEERAFLCRGLLRYCELDSLAMVMLYEGWRALMGYGYMQPSSVFWPLGHFKCRY